MDKKFIEFLNMPDIKKAEWVLGRRPTIFQRLNFRWWMMIKKCNPQYKAEVLFESIRKGRF